MYLSPFELAVLRALEDRAWKVPVEIAALSDVHVQLVRSQLKNLARAGMVERGGWGNSMRWGEWRITGTGTSELNQRNQLRLA